MRVFGNIMNRIAETIPPQVPAVGMGATILMHSDRYPATIVEVRNPKTIVIQEDHAKRTDTNGASETQTYVFAPDLQGAKHVLTLRKNGTWMKQGESMKHGTIVRIGTRDKYYDFSF